VSARLEFNLCEAKSGYPLEGDFERMAKRRFQSPTPFREGNFWWIKPYTDSFINGRLERKRQRVKVCPATTPQREALKIAAELLRPMNQGLETLGSAMQLAEYVAGTYRPIVLPTLAATTQDCYVAILRKHILPTFGEMPLRELSTLTLQKYFSQLGSSALGSDTVAKVKGVLSAVLASAQRFDLLTRNPMLAVEIPRSKRVNTKKQKPHISPTEFDRLLALVEEPYATMIYVAVYSGLRFSELAALRWEDVHEDAITVDERYCRGSWSITKTTGSSATVGVDQAVIARIHRLKTLEVEINWGGHGARKRFKVVRATGPQDLVFQSLRTGSPMLNGSILRRHLRPAAIKLGIDPKKVTWRALRRSYGTWMVEAGADPKSVQAQMRHSRISTTMEIYAQAVPESQRRAVAKMMDMVHSRRALVATTVN
jgi:integrase